MKLYVFLLLLLYDYASGVSFVTSPSDVCVPSGQTVELSCSTLDMTGKFAAGQEWIITTTGGGTSTYTADVNNPFPTLPAPYEWITTTPSGPAAGLRILNADSSFNDAMFQCIGIFGMELKNNSIPPARLEIAGPPSQFSCSATCPPMPFVSGLSDTCTVQWTRPQTASCAPIAGYTVTIATVNSSGNIIASTFIYETVDLEPFTNYTVTISAVNSLTDMTPCSYSFTTSKEEFPSSFTLQLELLVLQQIVNVSLTPTALPPPRVTYSVTVTDVTGQQVGGMQTFPGSSSSLSVDISSLPQCMSYTVSVTGSNTGGSTTTNAALSLDPLTSLEVSCVAGEDSCYLEASCVPSQTGLVSGCRLDYMSSAGSESRYATPLSISSRIAEVSCDNQTMISYTGRAYDSMLRALRCPRSGMTKCPLMRDCPGLDMITNGTEQYSTEPSVSGDFTGGTVATYSCADGYELVGEENRTCLVDGTWTGAEPQCRNLCLCQDASQDSDRHATTVWFPISITLLIYSVVSTAAIVALTLFSCRKILLKGDHRAAVPSHSTKEEVALKENLCYGPVAPPPPPPPVATQTVSEYEEIGAPSPRYL